MIDEEQASRAQKLFERLVAKDDNWAPAHFGLGRALLAQRQADAAIAALSRALQLDPTTRVHYRLGVAHELRGDKAKARESYQTFLSYRKDGKQAEEARKRLAALSSNR